MTHMAISIHNMEHLRKLAEFKRHVSTVALSPNNQHVACGSSAPEFTYVRNPDGSIGNDGSVTLLDYLSREQVCKLPTTSEGESVFRLAFSSNGRYLACAASDGLYVWDLEARKLVLKQPASGAGMMLCGLQFAKEKQNERLLLAYYDTVQIWDTFDWQKIAELRSWRGARADADFGSQVVALDGSRVAMMLDNKGIASVWNLQTERSDWSQAIGPSGVSFFRSICFHPAGDLLAVRGAESSISIWSIPQGTIVSELHIERGMSATSLAFSSDGRLLVSGLVRLKTVWHGEDVDVQPTYSCVLWDWEWGAPLAQLPGFGSEVVFSPDGSRLAVADFYGVQVWATAEP